MVDRSASTTTFDHLSCHSTPAYRRAAASLDARRFRRRVDSRECLRPVAGTLTSRNRRPSSQKVGNAPRERRPIVTPHRPVRTEHARRSLGIRAHRRNAQPSRSSPVRCRTAIATASSRAPVVSSKSSRRFASTSRRSSGCSPNGSSVRPSRTYLADYRFDGDVVGYLEGEVFTSLSPVLRIEGRFADIVLETLALSILNFDSGVATKAMRVVRRGTGPSTHRDGFTANERKGGGRRRPRGLHRGL